MTLGSLFAGIGGFELAARWAGIEPVWSNEIDPWCCKVLRKNFDHEIIEEDIRSLTADSQCMGRQAGAWKGVQSQEQESERSDAGNIRKKIRLPYTDIITGGFPCQPFSHAGKRKGTADDRYLWPEMLRIIAEVRPRWVVGENVAGLIGMEDGKTFETVLSDLENEGYEVQPYIIPACGVGAWHRRNRVWIVGRRDVSDTKRSNKGKTRGSKRISEKGRASIQEENKGREGKAVLDTGLVSISRNESENVPDTNNTRSGEQLRTNRNRQEEDKGREGQSQLKSCSSYKDVPDTNVQGSQGYGQFGQRGRKRTTRKDGAEKYISGNYWQSEPDVGRLAHGIPNRVDRLKGLGNAIVPQVAYEIFKAILEHEQDGKED